MLVDLMTPEGEQLIMSGEAPWQHYPRPQMRRDSYVNLNGQWDFTVSAGGILPEQYDSKITVPFCPESQLSGVKTHFPEGSPLFYRRMFSLPEGFCKGRVLLHIGAADQFSQVYVNQKLVAAHVGGYEAFSADITEVLREENEVVICVQDDLNSKALPYGKQTLKRGGMWYTPVSGIWQSVWLESVPKNAI